MAAPAAGQSFAAVAAAAVVLAASIAQPAAAVVVGETAVAVGCAVAVAVGSAVGPALETDRSSVLEAVVAVVSVECVVVLLLSIGGVQTQVMLRASVQVVSVGAVQRVVQVQ